MRSKISVLSQDNAPPPSPTVLGAMMLSLACSSLSRHGERILKGSGPRLRRGLAARRRGGPECGESVLEETALSWVTSWLQRAGRGEAEAAGRPSVGSGVFGEQTTGDVAWSRRRPEEESEERSDTGEDGGGEALLRCFCFLAGEQSSVWSGLM